MPYYMVEIIENKKKRTIKTLQSSVTEAEKEALSQSPDCEIYSVSREDDGIRVVRK